MSPCEHCGDDAGDRYRLVLEYPSEGPHDPGEATLSVCGDCADGVATNVLIDRAINLDIGIYDGLDASREVTAGD